MQVIKSANINSIFKVNLPNNLFFIFIEHLTKLRLLLHKPVHLISNFTHIFFIVFGELLLFHETSVFYLAIGQFHRFTKIIYFTKSR